MKRRIGKIRIPAQFYTDPQRKNELYAIFANIIPWRIEDKVFSMTRLVWAECEAFDEVDPAKATTVYEFVFHDEMNRLYVDELYDQFGQAIAQTARRLDNRTER